MSTVNPTPREELIANAVEFLLDKSIANSPLAKKIEFIESKGLTQEEIQEALTRSQNGNKPSSNTSYSASSASLSTDSTVSSHTPSASSSSPLPPAPPLPDYYYNAPPLPERDWKDYFVMATATAGVSYGIYQIVKRYVVPKILPPSKTAIENDKESISLEFQRIEELLDTFEKQQKDFYERQDAKAEKIDQTLTEIDEIINKTNEKNLNNEETLKYLKLEIENIKNTLMKNLDSQKSTITQELGNLETDLNDLKFQLKNINLSSIKSSTHLSTPPTEINQPAVTPAPAAAAAAAAPATSNTVPSLNLNIPPATSIPSLKDILQKEKERSISDSDISKYARETSNSVASSSSPNTSPEPSSIPSDSTGTKKKGIPAWQLAA